MQVTNIAGKEFTTIASLKAFTVEQGVDIKGSSKWVKSEWISAVEKFMNSKVVETAIEVKKTIVATEVESIEPALIAAITIEDAAVAVFKALTSPKACAAYRSALQAACLAIVFMALLVGKAACWCWENRDKTAVYHWIKDAVGSRWGLRLRTEILGLVLVLSVVVDDCRAKCREVIDIDRILARLGLGGGAIEIQ